MKKILLVTFILTLALSAFAYNPRIWRVMLQIDGGDILEYVNTPDSPYDTQPEFHVVVTDDTNGGTISTDTNTANIVRVVTALGPDGTAAWLHFDPQGFPTTGNVPLGAQFTATVTYTPNTDEATNSATRTFTAPPGTNPVYLWGDDAWVFPATMFAPAVEYDIDPDNPTPLPPADPEAPPTNNTVAITGGGFEGANLVTTGLTPVPNPTFVATSEGILQLVGTGSVDVVFTFDPPVDWFLYLEGGNWVQVEGPLVTYTVTVDLGAKDGELEFKGGHGGEPTLPVELSVFNAVLTAQNFVKLTWISESETNMLGYRVYRSETDELNDDALMITPIMIEATNTSTTQNYAWEDREVEMDHTYYYWLEAVDYGHSSFFGPQIVDVIGEDIPELPAQTAMRSAYPNPFKANCNTTIEVSVKEGDNGTVTIYNIVGQVVKTFPVSQGENKIEWNGRDSKGNACGSGIYFYKLSTPSRNMTKKMVIMR